VGGVGVNCKRLAADFWRQAVEFAGYGRSPHEGHLERACDMFMRRIPVESAQIGDVLGIRFSADTQHLAILVNHPTSGLGIIHSHSRFGGVVEHRYADVWRARTVFAWRMPEPLNG
jgi:hypothetical protein